MGQLTERAKQRLRIAAGLLRAEGCVFEAPRDQFYSQIQTFIDQLDQPQRDRLRALTDWVEAYDNALPPVPTKGA